jgi:type IV pilus assembly protein PilX
VTSPRPLSLRTLKSNQRGVVLFIALIVMVAMSLAAIALMRSVDTTSTVIGNLAFRQASILPANYAIEDAAAGLFSDANFNAPPRIADVRVDSLVTEKYYATHNQAAGWDDAHGVPQPLQTKPPATWPRLKVDDGQNQIAYVIERMCNPNAAGKTPDQSASGAWCDTMAPKQSPGATINDPSIAILLGQPFYRVTVRVDGPPGTNAVSFVQAMLR